MGEPIEKLTFRVEPDGGGRAARRLPRAPRRRGFSRSRLKALIKDGQVTLGRRRAATIRTPASRPAQTIDARRPARRRRRSPQAETIPLDILFEDCRPHRHRQAGRAGRASGRRQLDRHAGQRADRPLRRQPVRHRRRQAAGHRAPARQGHVRASWSSPRTTRRIARFPRNSPTTAATALLEREYDALVWGVPKPHIGAVDAPLNRDSDNRQKQAVARSGGRQRADAIMRSRSGFGRPRSLLTCRLETGRTHQIRVHMAHIGHPLVGDAVYGGGFLTKAETLAGRTAGRRQGVPPAGAACPAAPLRAPALRGNPSNLRRIGQRI